MFKCDILENIMFFLQFLKIILLSLDGKLNEMGKLKNCINVNNDFLKYLTLSANG